MPAATAPIVPDWKAHRMSSPPDPSISTMAIAPSAQMADASRRTTMYTIQATTMWRANVTPRYGQYDTVPTVPTRTR